ncbi:phosphoribosylanthranilate isomerase [Janthinobacterium lividum]|uniref:phosphoribosylanthranilate isomerase n=1 Tax=Janthinobacterium lividum TaxID=29581 RepID=UPI000892FFB9|nr:phosphoribosylanthranilate isomerase [Janthinobacterium lividum]MCC7716403.1 phosphoribosylanthranilate isomerase [Janthinobacterium lividum]OEZ52714.1 N-(5'-phosphoribosyl)anthranilate isomerase [Janthinobacterium lividum]WQE30955.1 phosphoribosylanthranilate isomerase [Janthinobacterium lividum]STQ96479.1 N-(5'-phosphoribosyl)anthranilate isomerase [Janthinobacterium lividum]
MRTRIKICCIASIDEAQLAIAAGADALGLVAAMPSGPGPIPDARIAQIAAWTPPPVATFLLTSETTAQAIAEHVRATQPSTVQIVSHIDPGEVAQLARLLPHVRRVQVIHVEGPQALALIPAYAPHVHAFLLDSGRPGAQVPELGGTGRTHDWSVSARFVRASPRPVFLAGGLDDTNVADALRQVRPYGIDLCSRVRTDGKLDVMKLALLMAAVRDVDAALYAEG